MPIPCPQNVHFGSYLNSNVSSWSSSLISCFFTLCSTIYCWHFTHSNLSYICTKSDLINLSSQSLILIKVRSFISNFYWIRLYKNEFMHNINSYWFCFMLSSMCGWASSYWPGCRSMFAAVTMFSVARLLGERCGGMAAFRPCFSSCDLAFDISVLLVSRTTFSLFSSVCSYS